MRFSAVIAASFGLLASASPLLSSGPSSTKPGGIAAREANVAEPAFGVPVVGRANAEGEIKDAEGCIETRGDLVDVDAIVDADVHLRDVVVAADVYVNLKVKVLALIKLLGQ